MNFRSNTIQQINKPTEGPSSQDFLSQSIVKSVHNPSNSSIFTKKQNNNALPEIQTDMLASFNPEAFEMRRQESFRGRQMSQRSNFISPRFHSQSKVKVNFSYGANYQQNFYNTPFPSINIQSVHRYNELMPTHNNLMNRSHSLNVVRPQSSLETTKDYSNLSEMSKLKKPLQTISSYPLSSFQKKQTELKKTHKLGKKTKPFQSLKKNNMGQQIKSIPSHLENIQKDSNQTSFEVVQSPRKNISSISIERSEYVFMSQKKQQQKINIESQTYVYSNNYLASKRRDTQKSKPFGFNLAQDNTSMILPIEEQQDSEMHMPVLTENISSPLSKSKGIKSTGKIDNRIYLQQQNPVSLSSMSMLRKLQSKDSRLSEDQQLNKISKISKLSHKNRKKQEQKSAQNEKAIVSPFAKLQHYQQIQKVQKQHKQQRQSLQQRIFSLQQQLKNKQQENTILKNKLQNTQLQKEIQSQYQKLQIVSKLNQVEIKKLQNQIKMFKIKQKIYQNKQKEHTQIISSLKQQVKSIKNSSGIMSLNIKNRFTTGGY